MREMIAMTTTAKVPQKVHDGRRYARYTVFGVMALFLGFVSAFVIGETFMDPGGAAAVLLVSLWLLPAAALSVFALLRPARAEQVLLVVTGAAAVFVVVESLTDVIPQNDVGPVAAIVAFATSIPLAFLGLRRAGTAGRLLVGLGLALAVGALVGGPAASAMVFAAPLLIAGVLFWMVAEPSGGRRRGPAPPTTGTAH
jgi:hypothetical protein